MFAAGLVVVLDAAATLRLESADMGERVVEIVDLGINISRFRAIDNLAGREYPGAEDHPGPLHFAGDEYFASPARRIMDGGRAQREIL